MRFRLFKRRSFFPHSRNLAIRHHLPWPARLLLLFLILGAGLSAMLWLYEKQRPIWSREAHEVQLLRTELERTRAAHFSEKEAGTSYDLSSGLTAKGTGVVSNGSLGLHADMRNPLEIANQTTIDLLSEEIRTLKAENQSLRDDLGFYEYLLPMDGSGTVAIRRFEAEPVAVGHAEGNDAPTENASEQQELQWHLLVMQPRRDTATFKGQLQLLVRGTRNGKPWEQTWPTKAQELEFTRYQRVEGRIPLPQGVVPASLTAHVLGAKGQKLSSERITFE